MERIAESQSGVLVLLHRPETADALIEFAKDKLGSVKAPKKIEIWPDLPRSPVGKVLKTEIRKQFWTGAERAVN